MYTAIVGGSIIPDLVADVGAEMSKMAEEGGEYANLFKRNVERQLESIKPTSLKFGAASSGGAPAGTSAGGKQNVHVDMRWSVMRDDKDMYERLARAGNNGDIAESIKQYEKLLTTLAAQRKIADAAAQFERIWLNAADSVGDALTTALFDGAKSGADAIKGVMENLARDLVQFWIRQNITIQIQQQLFGGADGATGLLGGAVGGALGAGLIGRSIGGNAGALGGIAGSLFAGRNRFRVGRLESIPQLLDLVGRLSHLVCADDSLHSIAEDSVHGD
jgi:hypothetical protein